MRRLFIFLVCIMCIAHAQVAQIRIAGNVVDEYGMGVPKIKVFANSFEAITDAEGYFQIENLQAGQYRIRTVPGSFEEYINIRSDTTMRIPYKMAYDIPEIQIRASRPLENDPFTFNKYDSEILETLDQGRDVPFVLQFNPSTYVTSDAGTGIGYTGIRIRGSDPTRTNVTINGVPLNDAESQTVFWVDLPDILSSTQDVVVQRGVGTSTNGAGAFGASINLNTNKNNPDPYARFDGLVGSFNTRKASISFGSGNMSNFYLDGRLSLIESDGFIDRATADLNSYYLSGAYVNDRQSIRFNVFSGHEITYQAWNGVPRDSLQTASGRTYNSAGTEKPGEPYDNEVDNYRQTHYQFFYNQKWNDDWSSGITLHYTKGAGYFEQYKANQNLVDYQIDPLVIDGADPVSTSDLVRQLWLDNDYYGAIFNTKYTPNSTIDLTLSGAYSRYEGLHFGEVVWVQRSGSAVPGQRYYDNDAVKTDWNAFAKLSARVSEQWSLMADMQIRGIEYTFTGIDLNLNPLRQSIDLLFFNPKLGATYFVNERFNVYASAAVAHKEPSRADFVSRPSQRHLDAERLIDFELGLRNSLFNGFSYAINGYYMLYRDQLLPTGELNEVGAYVRDNVDESYRLGIELEGQYAKSERFQLGANLAFSRNRITRHTEFVDIYDENFNYLGQEGIDRSNTEIALSPNVVAGLNTRYVAYASGAHQVALRLDGKYVGEQFIGNASDNSNTLDAFHFADVEIAYELDVEAWPDFTLRFGVRNVYDAEYETNAWSYRYIFDGVTYVDQGFYPQAGRNYYLRFESTF